MSVNVLELLAPRVATQKIRKLGRMPLKKLVVALAAGSLTASSLPALAQETQAPPPAPGQSNANQPTDRRNAPPGGAAGTRLTERQIAIIAAALAGVGAFTAAVASSGSSRPRPTSP
jgi:hypothetical protein